MLSVIAVSLSLCTYILYTGEFLWEEAGSIFTAVAQDIVAV